MKQFIIPKRFTLGGHDVSVELTPVTAVNAAEAMECGHTTHIMHTIALHETCYGVSLPQARISEAFFHEMFHNVLEETLYTELSNDEAFVTRVSRALHQVAITSIGDLLGTEAPCIPSDATCDEAAELHDAIIGKKKK